MDNWDLMDHWRLVLPPSRPSNLQLSHIRSQIADVDRNLPVAVLGSTPEFRDLFHELGFSKIFVLDKNARFFESMSTARIYRNKESFVNQDWLRALPSFGSTFAVILSDLTSGNIAYDKRAEFYGGISHALMDGGMFFDKVLTHTDPLLSVDNLVHKYSLLPLNLVHINYFSSEMFFCSELIDIESVVNTSLFYGLLDRRITNERVRAFTEKAKAITPPGCIWWYGRRWDELQGDYCVHLERISVTEDEQSSPYYGYLKFFHFRKGQ